MMRPVFGCCGIEIPDPRHMDIFAGDPPEILPGVAQGGLDPGGVLVREGGAQVGLADAMRRQPGADAPGDRAAQVRGAIRVGAAQQADQRT